MRFEVPHELRKDSLIRLRKLAKHVITRPFNHRQLLWCEVQEPKHQAQPETCANPTMDVDSDNVDIKADVLEFVVGLCYIPASDFPVPGPGPR